jgi:hypothetical protein
MRSLSKTLDVKTRDGIALALSEASGCEDRLAAHSYVSTNLAKPPRGDRAEPAGPFRRPEAAGCGGVREGPHRGARRGVRRPVSARWTDANIVGMIGLTAQFLLTNLVNNAVQTPIDFPEVSPAKAA